MKAYLQRLAASASQPEPRLHPFVGSIFAGESREENVEEVQRPLAGHFTKEAAREPAAPGQEVVSIHAPGEIAANPPHIHLPVAEEVVDATRPDAHRPQRFSSLLPPPGAPAESPVPRRGENPPERPVQASSHAAKLRNQEQTLRKSFPEETRAGIQSIAAPPIVRPFAVEQARAESPEVGVPQAGALPAATPEPMRTIAIRSVRPEREEHGAAKETVRAASEEIQIHIGRIEVIAAATPAPRATAPPASRSTSLEEYLKHRSGRAG